MAGEHLVSAYGIYFPDQGWNPGPLHWEPGVLASGPPGQVPSAPKSVLRSQIILPKATFLESEAGRGGRDRAFYFGNRTRFSSYLWLKRNFPKRNRNSSHRVSNDENQAQMVWTENIKSDAVTMVKWDDIFAFFFLSVFKISLRKKSCCFKICFPLLPKCMNFPSLSHASG